MNKRDRRKKKKIKKRDRREGRERGDICIHIVIPSVVQQKLAQHYKAIILEEKKKD